MMKKKKTFLFNKNVLKKKCSLFDFIFNNANNDDDYYFKFNSFLFDLIEENELCVNKFLK